MTTPDGLDALLDEVRTATRLTRIELRDRVASYGAPAIEPMADWLDDAEFSAFAVRVLERIGRMEGQLPAVARTLSDGHANAPAPWIARDIEEALSRLGSRLLRPERTRSGRSVMPPPPGRPGKPGRHYWAMRTSQWRPDFIWAEVRRGRLRQGWGSQAEQDLRLIATRRQAGIPLSPEELAAWPARRMLTTEPDGIHFDDLIVTQNLPRQGRISICRVIGPYDYAIEDVVGDYGHILPVELLAEDVGRHSPQVSDALRHAISLRPRLYEITPYGGDVEAILTTS
jgi:hypothetical protein